MKKASSTEKQYLGEDIEQKLRKFLNSVEFESGREYHIGKVEDNNDPDKEGKVKVRVYAKYGTQIPTSDLPWAVPDTDFIGSGVGGLSIPPIGSLVNVYFPDGIIYNPHYTTKVFNKKLLPDQRLENYPNTVVMFETDAGDYLTFDRETFEMKFRHASGVTVNINKKGDVKLDASQPSSGTVTLTSRGKVVIECPEIEIANDMGSTVTPNPALGGPFCSLPNCLFTGAPHTGKNAKNCLVKSSDSI